MTTPDERNELRYAEYVLGVLDADARAEVAREIQTLPEAATAVALWEQRLAPLTGSIRELPPPPYLWARIREALQLDIQTRSRPTFSIWDSLRLWRWVGVGAIAVAAALALVVSVPGLLHPAAPAGEAAAGYMASTIQQDNGATGWTATMDLKNARMIVVPGTPVALEAGRAPELWLIPQGGKPISVGMIARDKPTTLALDRAMLARLGPTAALAVSVEPPGGSPTGQPTGAVIAKGAITAAPESTGPHTASVSAARTDRPTV